MGSSPDNKNRSIRSIMGAVLAAAAVLNWGLAVYWWFGRGFTWRLGPLKFSLHQWEKPWLAAMGFWLLAIVVRPRPFLPNTIGPAMFDPRDVDKPSPVRTWAVFGIFPAITAAFAFAQLNQQIFPSLGHVLAFAAAAAFFSAIVHAGWAWLFEKTPILLSRDEPEPYRAGLRSGYYLLAIAGAVYFWGRRWEGRYYDELTPFIEGAVLGLVMAMAAGRKPFARAKGFIGRRKVFAAAAAIYLGIMLIGFLGYLRALHSEGPDYRILFITLDTVRADHLSSYGYSRPTSPFIDEIAREGVRFERTIAPMGTTDPSHMTMFTGTYPRTHGCLDVGMPITGQVPSLPEHLAEKGFHTAAIVSRAQLSPTRDSNLPGFEYENVPFRTRHAVEASAANTFRRAASWLTKNRDSNAFVWVHFFDPHMPYEPHPGFPVRWTDAHKECRYDTWLPPEQFLSPDDAKRCIDLYDGEIAYTDYWVKQLVTFTRTLEPPSRYPLFIVIVADHGEALGEYREQIQYDFGHTGIINQAVARVPLIISWPGVIPEGKVVGEIVEHADIAPTLLDYLFGEHDFPGQGQNLRPLIEGKQRGDGLGVIQRWKSDTQEIKPYNGEDRFGVYKGDFKLFATPGRPLELYRPFDDPLEKDNLVENMPDKTSELSEDLEAWEKRTPLTKPAEQRRSSSNDSLEALGYINAGGGKDKTPQPPDGKNQDKDDGRKGD